MNILEDKGGRAGFKLAILKPRGIVVLRIYTKT